MLTANGTHHNGSNGVHSTRLYPACPSDYEERPTIDITPKATPKPGWQDQFPAFTHNLSWVDADGCSHSMTHRSDDLQSLMSDLKLLKGMIKQSKQKATVPARPPESHAPQVTAADVPDVKRCDIHGVDMARRWSKRTQGHYFAHKLPTGDFCYGRAPKA